MMFDAIRLAMMHAVDDFGDNSRRIFNAAGFSSALNSIAGCHTPLDGKMVQAILCGRGDVMVLWGGSHFELLDKGDA